MYLCLLPIAAASRFTMHVFIHKPLSKEFDMKTLHCLFIALLTVILFLSMPTQAYTIETYCPDSRPKSWPSNWGKWGPNDEIGTLNYITPNVIKAASKLIRKGKIISLAMNATPDVSPKWPGRKGLIRYMATDGSDFLVDRPTGNLGGTESSILIEDHGSTHLDPLVHVWWGNCTYNNYPAPEIVHQVNGVTKGSSNAYIPKSFTRGVLIDVAGYLGKDYVESINGSSVLTPEMIEKIASAQKVSIAPGTALLIRTGWLKRWTDVEPEWTEEDGEVGISCGIEEWLQEKRIALLGADNVALEAVPATPECNAFYQVEAVPMHIGVLSMLGVPIIELMDLDELAKDCAEDGVYEFALSFAPFRYHNASGGLVSPTAIK